MSLVLSELDSDGIATLTLNDPASVSYTHLDVYKRQGLSSARTRI